VSQLLKDEAIELDIPMTADHNSAVVDVRDFEYALFTAKWAGANAADATIELQISNDETTNFEGYPQGLYNILEASGAHHWCFTAHAIPFVRFSMLHGSNTAGLMSLTAWIKRR
jgi:hypothetical protein